MFITEGRNQVFSEHKLYWETGISKSKRDLRIKQFAVALIGLINFAVIGAGVYFAMPYLLNVPKEVLVIAYIVTGALIALNNLKFPTCGAKGNHPLALLGTGTGYFFFGPLKLAIKQCDWTAYHDLETVDEIRNLKEGKFEDLAKHYGKHFKNCFKYKVLWCKDNKKTDFFNLYYKYKLIQRELIKLEKKGTRKERIAELNKQKEEIETQWNSLRGCFSVPHTRSACASS